MQPGEYDALFSSFAALPRQTAVDQLLAFLRSRDDGRTGLDFAVGAGGVLLGAPTGRVTALDFLGRLDTAAAKDMAVEVMDSSRSPDEWALCLRNYAWGNGRVADEYFLGRVAAFLDDEEWQSRPSAGYLHGFDAGVFAGGADMARRFTALSGPTKVEGVRYAAFLALDRMMGPDPATVLQVVAEGREALGDKPERRSRIFAKANPADGVQIALLRDYLTRLTDTREAALFAARFPNFDVMYGEGLLTESPMPRREDIVRGDKAALGLLDQWSEAPLGSPLDKLIPAMRSRLVAFQQSAAIGDTEDQQSGQPPPIR